MIDRGFSRRVGLLLMALAMLTMLPWAAGAASAGARDTWLPFDEERPAGGPSLSVTVADASAIDLAADLPGCFAAAVETKAGLFTRLDGEGYGFPTQYGLPELPVLRRDVEIPYGARVALEVLDVGYRDYTLSELGLAPIYPLQPPLVKEPGAEERPPVVDEAFYRSGDRYPEVPVRLGETYVVRGHRVQTVEVWPVAYDPAADMVRFYHTVRFRLALDGADVTQTEAMAGRYASPAFEASLAHRILNYNQGRGALPFAPDAAVGYLIITADAYHDALQPFVTMKASHGFDVTVTKLSQIPGGSSNTAIKAYIQDAYDTWPLPPSYVLLVGDTDTMPGWPSVSAGEITDLYYATMDGDTDWHPDLGRGRFPVRSVAQTTIMVDKYLEYAMLTGNEAWLKWASFIATCDQYTVAEGTHNYAIDNYTLPGGYMGIFPNDPQLGGDKLYCITYGATRADVHASVGQGRWAVIYSGHGGHTGWEFYGASDVRTLTNAGMYPFVASHACITGDFEETEVYGETWVLEEEAGALVFWGSSDNSFWDEDDILERAMFDSFFDDTDGYPDVTEMTYYGLAATEAAYPSSARYYWETYNILGDPAVKIFMEPEGDYAAQVEPTDLQVCAGGDITATVNILNPSGLTETISLDAGPLPAGVLANFNPMSAPAPFVSTLTLSTDPATAPGQYQIAVTATNGVDWEAGVPVDLEVVDGVPAGPVLVSPPDGAPAVPLLATLEWAAEPGASGYRLQLARNPFFDAPLYDIAGIAGTSYTIDQPLDGGRCHWWRVGAENACGEGAWSEVSHFCSADMSQVFYDDIEAGSGLWSHEAAQGVDYWDISTYQSHSPTHSWFVPDSSSITDSYLWNTAPVEIDEGTTLTFWHRYQFEGSDYDGAVLEISTDGLAWSDLGAYITQGGYNGTINTCCGNPLGGRQAWTGDLTTWTEVEVDLSAFAGQTAQVRWRIGTDSSISDMGWYIDDVTITSPLPPNPQPLILDIIPDEGPVGVEVPVEIHGNGFVETPLVQLGDTWLVSVTQISSMTLEAVVPAMATTGTYTLTLINGDCQQATMTDAYTVIGSPTFTLEVTPGEISVCVGDATSATAAVGSVAGYSATVSLSAEGLPYGAAAAFDPASAPAPFDASVTVTASLLTPAGSHGMWVRASGEDPGRLPGDLLVFVPLDVVDAVPDAPLPVTPTEGVVGQPLAPTFVWDPATGADGYRLQVARSPLFETPVLDLSNLTTTTYTATQPLDAGRSHWWRVGGGNVCGEGSWSEASFFCTASDEGLPAPALFAITPHWGPPGSTTAVWIEGSGFVETPAVRLGGTWLLSVMQVSSTTLTAVVPAGMPTGTYSLTLVNGDCQEAVLEEAFTVTEYGVRLYLPLLFRRGE